VVDIARGPDAPPPDGGDPGPDGPRGAVGEGPSPSRTHPVTPVGGPPDEEALPTVLPAQDDPVDRPPPAKPGVRNALVAFRYRNFTLFWTGALLSSSGNWMQAISIPFVVFQITQSEAWVGLAAVMQFGPVAIAGPIGGTLADRYDRRTVLLVTQSAQALAAFGLWLAWSSGVRSIGAILGIVAVNGLIAGLNIPSWQAFVSELVPREHMLNAVTLNSAQFNAARAFGPALGGLVLGFLGVGWAFFLNGVSFLAVIGALLLIAVPKLAKAVGEHRQGVIAGFVESARYSARRPGIWVCLVVVLALGGLGSPMNQLFAVFADDVYHVGDVAYGFLAAAAGIGAVLGTPLVVGPGSRLARSRLTNIAMLAYGAAVVAFGVVSIYGLGLVALLVTGAGYLAIASTLNTTIQLQVDETMRGKVIALYVMCLTLALPLGALLQGVFAQFVGPQVAVMVFGSLFLAVWAWLRFGGGDHLAAMDADPPIVR
jgi:MFS family permease